MTEGILDLDALRAADADATRKPLSVKLGGQTFTVARPLPLKVAVAAALGDIPAAIDGLFGTQAQAVLDAGVDLDDLKAIIDELLGGVGKATGSPRTSPKSGTRSKRTSDSEGSTPPT